MKYLFVGERPSALAVKMGVTWKDGRLAAKQLFDALQFCKVSLEDCNFANIFGEQHNGPELVCPRTLRRIVTLSKRGHTVIAMGQKVAKVLTDHVVHKTIVHPAARGRIRKKRRYVRHVRAVLGV